MPSLLDALPAELIQAITAFLKPRDLSSLRLTCKTFYELSLQDFGRTCLDELQTDLSSSSFDSLAVVAENPRLAPFVGRLVVYERRDQLLGRGFIWDRHPGGHVLFPQTGTQRLQDILTRLVNCKSFEIFRPCLKEGLPYSSDSLAPADTLSIFLNVFAGAGLPVELFHVSFKSCCVGSWVDGNRLHMPEQLKSKFSTAWSHLLNLRLALSVEPDFIENWAAELVIQAPKLQKLSIDFESGNNARAMMHRMSSADSLPPLRQLELENGYISGDDLLAFLRHSRRSLQTLFLSHIYLRPRTKRWNPIFASLRDEFSALQSITFPWIGDENQVLSFSTLLHNPFVNGSEGRKFIFSSDFFGAQECVRWVGYKGPNMSVALQTLMNSAGIE
jgi:hypothetical protein